MLLVRIAMKSGLAASIMVSKRIRGGNALENFAGVGAARGAATRFRRLCPGAAGWRCTGRGQPGPSVRTVKLVFIHHSSGENWLVGLTYGGRLGIALRDNNYFVSDTNYGWGPDSIGDRPTSGHWYDWFRGRERPTSPRSTPRAARTLRTTRLAADPGGENQIVMFKSCFPNSDLGGAPDDPPPSEPNPLRGPGRTSPDH